MNQRELVTQAIASPLPFRDFLDEVDGRATRNVDEPGGCLLHWFITTLLARASQPFSRVEVFYTTVEVFHRDKDVLSISRIHFPEWAHEAQVRFLAAENPARLRVGQARRIMVPIVAEWLAQHPEN